MATRRRARRNGGGNTLRTKFCIASMGKMFTAVAITQLVGRGKLAFSDTVGKYVPGFPSAIADSVTIDHLLTHTSGMGDAALERSPTSAPATTIAGSPSGTPGYEGQLDIYPDSGYAAVILTNQDDVLVPAIRMSEQILTG